MELSITSSAVYGVRENNKVQFLPELGIRQSAEAGFTRMEYNFLSGGNNRPLAGSNWQDVVVQLKQTLDEHKMVVPNTHNCWFLMASIKDEEDLAHKEEMARRSVKATAMLGSRNMVIHTQSIYDAEGYNPNKTEEYNRAFLSEMANLAAAENMQLWVENVFPIASTIDHACYPEEMAELMVQLNDPMFGICWDFGHANMAKVDHEKSLDIIAPWLRLIHVNDNKSTADDHVVPGYGTVPWNKVMKKLKANGYTGDMSLSVRTFAQTSLPNQRVEALRFLRKVGNDLIQMYHNT